MTDFDGADAVRIHHLGQTWELTPSETMLDFNSPRFFGSHAWTIEVAPGSLANPELTLTTSCPQTPATASSPVGYGLSIEDATTVLASLAGAGALAELISLADNDDWNTMAIRVDDVAATASVEVRGLPTHLSFPLTSTGTDSWSWTYMGDGVDLSGTLVRTANGLGWSATSGTIDLGAGPKAITPTSRTFDLLPTE